VNTLGALASEPVVDPKIAPYSPTEILKASPKGSKVRLPNLIFRSEAHYYADAPQPLLCAAGTRPCCCSASRDADKANKFAPSHCPSQASGVAS
jgi:hypothetical protein